MTYVRTIPSVSGRLCGHRARAFACVEGGYEMGARGSMGDAISAAGTGAPIAGDPVVALTAQVNRFAGSDAGSYQVIDQPFPLASGNLGSDVAAAAVMILQRRLAQAMTQNPDAGTKAQWAEVQAATSSPVPYVTKNLVPIMQSIAAYGDASGLAPATVGIVETTGTGLPGIVQFVKDNPIPVAIGAVAIWFLFGRRRKR